jgi:hypothetical protein
LADIPEPGAAESSPSPVPDAPREPGPRDDLEVELEVELELELDLELDLEYAASSASFSSSHSPQSPIRLRVTSAPRLRNPSAFRARSASGWPSTTISAPTTGRIRARLHASANRMAPPRSDRSVRPSAPYPCFAASSTSVSGVHAPSPKENALWVLSST